MSYLTKETLLQKLAPYGVSSWQGVSRLIREQGLPTKYLTLRKPFFDEKEVDVWVSMRGSGNVPSSTLRTKPVQHKRKGEKDGTAESPIGAELKAFRKIEGGQNEEPPFYFCDFCG
jgi:hypothetical protein